MKLNKLPLKNQMKKIIKSFKTTKINFVPKIDLIIDGDNIICQLTEDMVNSKFALEIKHRHTGRRLEKIAKSDMLIFSFKELLEMEEYGIFDVYYKNYDSIAHIKKRVKYTSQNQLFKAISKEKGLVLKSYSTTHNNLSLMFEKRSFDYNINQLNVLNDKIVIDGELEIFDDDISDIDKIEIIGRNRLDSQSNVFDMKFKKDSNNLKFNFEGIIDEITSTQENILNLRIDFYLRIYSNGIYYQNLIDLNTYQSYSNDEDRFLFQIRKDENIYSYYVTQNRHSFALWITTETSWEKTYAIAKGRTIYKEYSEHSLDSNMVFFESFLGKSYSGNPKYIYETMLEMGLDKKFTFVWAYSGENKDVIPGNPIIVDRFEAGDYYKYLALSKYWINNIIFPIHAKRPGNVYVQTWHGTPLKRLGYDITIPGPEVEGRQNFYNESRNWDYLLSSNHYSTEIFERAFKFRKKFLEIGYPINDIFFRDNAEFIENLRNKLNIPSNKKIILYAPTWKDDEQNESWEHYFNLEIDLERLYSEFKDDYVILLKMHHLVSENLVIDDKMKDFAIDLSDYEDIQELYIISDILITDYSSVFFDYAHSRRPILFFVPDLNHYMKNVRGLYLNMENDLPGPLIKDNNELIYIIKNINQVEEDYKDKYDEFYERFCSLCSGNSGKELVKMIFKN